MEDAEPMPTPLTLDPDKPEYALTGLLTALLVALLLDATIMVTVLLMLLTDTRLASYVHPMPNPLTLDPTCG